MPRGSKPGERRGGRKIGTPNKKPSVIAREVFAPAIKRFVADVERVKAEWGEMAALALPKPLARNFYTVATVKQRALDALAKHLGMFVEKHEVDAAVRVVIEYEDHTPEASPAA